MYFFRARAHRRQHHIVTGMNAAVGAACALVRQVAFAQYGTRNGLVLFVGHHDALGVADGRHKFTIHERAEGVVVVRVSTKGQAQATRHIHFARITLGIRRRVIGKAGLRVGANLVAHLGSRFVIVDRADDTDSVRVVSRDQDQRVVAVGLGPIPGLLDGAVEHDGVVYRTLRVQRVRVLVDARTLNHQHEALLVA